MKLPSLFDKFLPKNSSEKELFSSLVLDKEYAAAALWEIDERGVPSVLATNSSLCADDSWESRLDAIDDALAQVEDSVGTTTYSKVVLGVAKPYLTPEGDIQKEIRPHIKSITKELALQPIGFVSLSQAILYRIKKEEGVPPSVILITISKKTITVSIYKVGTLAYESTHDRAADAAITLEEALKSSTGLEVFPARMLLYGYDKSTLEDVKMELLRYPWTTRVNFLHFPKIEILSPGDVAAAVSLAGASEIAQEVVEEQEVVQEAIPTSAEVNAVDEEEAEEIIEEESNVVAVDPANLGFKKDVDVLEEVDRPKKRFVLPTFSIPRVPLPVSFGGGKKSILIGVIAVIILIAIVSWVIPYATVTVLILPKSLSATATLTIDPTATTVDASKNTIPGYVQEKSVSGQKTVAVSGKKNVGDPARGSVTIYNKMTDTKTFAKGTVISTGTLSFTLDDAVTVDAATITGTLGSETKTFGQKTVTVTASAIGTESNIAANKTFSIKGYSTDEATAINTQAFSGGTSRSITVVSRADQDALLKAVSTDLVDKAKQELSGSVSGGQKLIDETVKTSVTQKTFAQELDQEATELSGNVTMTISGTSYNQEDVKALMKAQIGSSIPANYTLAESRTQVTLDSVKLAKDGKLTAKASITADAIPTLDGASIQKHLAGKTISAAEAYVRSIPGVGGVEVRFKLSFSKTRLPMNASHITVGTAIQ